MPILNVNIRAALKIQGCLQGTRRGKQKPAQAGWKEEERTSPNPLPSPNCPCSPPLPTGSWQTCPAAQRPACWWPDRYCFCSWQPLSPGKAPQQGEGHPNTQQMDDPQGFLNLRVNMCSGSGWGGGKAHPQPDECNAVLSAQGWVVAMTHYSSCTQCCAQAQANSRGQQPSLCWGGGDWLVCGVPESGEQATENPCWGDGGRCRKAGTPGN